MGKDTLYIIGNGFDLHHGMKSRFCDFKNYLVEEDSCLLKKLEDYFGSDDLWSDFEETLANLDTEQIVDECLIFLESDSVEFWSEAYHHDYQFEIQNRIDIITENLKELFNQWILQLELPYEAINQKIELKPNSVFINFNYTDTLEQLYGVSNENIFYIHNKAVNSEVTLILGHNRNPKNKKSIVELYNNEDLDVRIAEGNRILDSYFEETYKSTGNIIQENKTFFKGLSGIKEIYILGHSLSKVDIPYFEEIIHNIDKSKTKWMISVHSIKELAHHKEVIEELGVEISLVEYASINDFNTKQFALFPNDRL